MQVDVLKNGIDVFSREEGFAPRLIVCDTSPHVCVHPFHRGGGRTSPRHCILFALAY